MEYADGGSLQSYLKENFNKLEWNEKYQLAFQLASAVECMHSEGIIHCDLVITIIKIFLLFVLLLFILINKNSYYL